MVVSTTNRFTPICHVSGVLVEEERAGRALGDLAVWLAGCGPRRLRHDNHFRHCQVVRTARRHQAFRIGGVMCIVIFMFIVVDNCQTTSSFPHRWCHRHRHVHCCRHCRCTVYCRIEFSRHDSFIDYFNYEHISVVVFFVFIFFSFVFYFYR
jgi:hypothetical protein